jgi:hypothetical protein
MIPSFLILRPVNEAPHEFPPFDVVASGATPLGDKGKGQKIVSDFSDAE